MGAYHSDALVNASDDESKGVEVNLPCHPHPLQLQYRHGVRDCEFCCTLCGENGVTTSDYFYDCDICRTRFHKECAEGPYEPEITHPYHPSHPLTLIYLGRLFGCSEEDEEDEEEDEDDNDNDGGDCNDKRYDFHCFWCREGILYEEAFYHCDAGCGFGIHGRCGREAVLEIEQRKIHEHPLQLIPRERCSFTCNACGTSDGIGDPFYACLRCDFIVHRDCTCLPRVVKISRHPHRLSHKPSLPRREWSCGVCRGAIDWRYGAFSCDEAGCHYTLHTRCATKKYVWDGKDLEGEPEAEEDVEELPFEKVSDNVIRHFAHEHDLRLHDEDVDDGVHSESERKCDACCLPVDHGPFYSCATQPDFILHEVCANLPRKKPNDMHPHPLTLLPPTNLRINLFNCYKCYRACNGFRYACTDEACSYFQLDVICGSISEPFSHKSHPHPLFLHKFRKQAECTICGYIMATHDTPLRCISCDFVLCFACATLPDTARYKYDEHPLAISRGGGACVCEKCEKGIDPTTLFYACDECDVALHAACLLGRSPYLKPGRLRLQQKEHDIVPNANRVSRFVCGKCGKRCQDSIAFYSRGKYFCSLFCAL